MFSLGPPTRTGDNAGLEETKSHPPNGNLAPPVANHHPEHQGLEYPDGDVLLSFQALRPCVPPIEAVPQELLLRIFGHLVHFPLDTGGFPQQETDPEYRSSEGGPKDNMPNLVTGDPGAVNRMALRRICLVSRKFNMAATSLLYRCAHLATIKSPDSFLLTLSQNPGLRPLVRHISVPTGRKGEAYRCCFAFCHDTDNWQSSAATRSRELPVYFCRCFCGQHIDAAKLRLMLGFVPNLVSLVIPQTSLLGGPFTRDLVLANLTKLRIVVADQIEVTNPFSDSCARTVSWLSPGYLGHRFPALQRLEIHTPSGSWEADLVTDDAPVPGCGLRMKYVESVKMMAEGNTVVSEWDLMSLRQPIFDPSKLRTLKFWGPGYTSRDDEVSYRSINRKWDLSRFLAEKGSGLRTLVMDWELHNYLWDGGMAVRVQEAHFGPHRCLTAIDELANLAHLTISIQALFGSFDAFKSRVARIEANPEAELAGLLPPSLRTLRISEYVPEVYDMVWLFPSEDSSDLRALEEHHDHLYRFLQALRIFWLMREEGRELWFRRSTYVFLLEREISTTMTRRIFDDLRDQETANEVGNMELPSFQRVPRPVMPDMGWDLREDDD